MLLFLKSIRYKNLLMIAVMQLIFLYGFLKVLDIPLALNDWHYFLLIMATVSIAAGGYIINNIVDQETDAINKPDDRIIGKFITEQQANVIYIILNIIGVGIGFYLSNYIAKPGFTGIFIVTAITLYIYASSLKQGLLIGNIIVALLTALSVIIIGLFMLYPMITVQNQSALAVIFKIILDYALFAFIINFIREIVKDLEDINGDYNLGMKTLPIVLGVDRTKKLVALITVIPIVMLLNYVNVYFLKNNLILATLYAIIVVIAPLTYFSIKTWSAKTKKDFNHLSTVLKIILFFGILSIFIITYNIKYHA
ncbi:MAG TPA: geranylgeranylglycerol-phosphate geranylgeranyltransferase [Flavobacterium sp.]